jgi:uncharacterized protein with GYD domain
MAKYIILSSWTEQGIKNIKDSATRLDAARALAKKMGCTLGDFYMTSGATDMAIIAEAPDDETMARFSLTLASGGNIRTNTMKAFTEDTYRKIIGGL